MKKTPAVSSFRKQMSQSMAELRAIMVSGASPTFNDRLTARTIEVAEPSLYDAKRIKQIREKLNVSQSVFAKVVGVSDVLVRSWERGAREPAPIARRLLDQISAHPEQFVNLVYPFQSTRRASPALKRAV
jgi:putative transcriptional regulator